MVHDRKKINEMKFFIIHNRNQRQLCNEEVIPRVDFRFVSHKQQQQQASASSRTRTGLETITGLGIMEIAIPILRILIWEEEDIIGCSENKLQTSKPFFTTLLRSIVVTAKI
jgi:hypothetical protein